MLKIIFLLWFQDSECSDISLEVSFLFHDSINLVYEFPKEHEAEITVVKRNRNPAESFAGPWIPLLTLNSFYQLDL